MEARVLVVDREQKGSVERQWALAPGSQLVVFGKRKLNFGAAGSRLELSQRSGKSWVSPVKRQDFVECPSPYYFKGQGGDNNLAKRQLQGIRVTNLSGLPRPGGFLR